jgi:hypothetical protein
MQMQMGTIECEHETQLSVFELLHCIAHPTSKHAKKIQRLPRAKSKMGSVESELSFRDIEAEQS